MVSIIIPTINEEKNIGKEVKKVLSFKLKKTEVILIGGVSKDKT